MTTDENITRIADQLRAASRMHIRDGKSVPPTVFVIARDNPVTGEPASAEAPIIPIVQPNTINKDAFSAIVRAVVVASRAQAVIFCADTWYVRLKKPVDVKATEAMSAQEKLDEAHRLMGGVAPSQHEDRIEAIAITVEYDDGRVHRSHQPYVRDQGRIIFENPEVFEGKRGDLMGRMVFMVDPAMGTPPSEAMSQARNLSGFILQGVDWLPSEWAAVEPGEEEAQVANG